MTQHVPKLSWTAPWLARLIQPYLGWAAISALSALTLVGFNLLRAGLVARLVENALSGSLEALTQAVLLLIPAVLLSVLATWAKGFYANRASILVMADLKARLVQRITRAKVAQIEEWQAGELLTRLNKDVASLGKFFAAQYPNLLFQPLMFLGSSIYLLSINWKLFSACYILLPLTFKVATTLNRRGAAYGRDYHEGLDTANSLVKECIEGVVTVKTFNLEEHFLGKCRRAFDNVLEGLMKKELCDSLSLPFYFLTYESPRIICVLAGGYLTLQGEMSIGELVAATQLVSYVSAPAFALMRLINGIREGGVAAGRLEEVFALEEEPQGQGSLVALDTAPAIQCQAVAFAYQNDLSVLKNLSFIVPRQGLIALVGASGGGKSTIISLLSGFFQPQAGEIRLFGHSSQEHSPQALRSLVAYVPQDSALFPGTILDNIRLGNSDASQEEVQKAVSVSNVAQFSESLPQGLNAVLGQGGRGLSGGQRQRVAIARAVVKGAPLLIMDEPTSALDPASEALINQTLQELAKTQAVLVISHRLSTIQGADKIIVIDQGQVVQEGCFQELAQKSGAFTRLFGSQLAGEVV